MNNEQVITGNEKELEADELEAVECESEELSTQSNVNVEELMLEIEALRSRVVLLAKDNAELISDNLALRTKTEDLLSARAALPEFSVKTEGYSDKYGNVREAFKNKNPFIKKR